MQIGYKKIAILNKYLMDNCWTFTLLSIAYRTCVDRLALQTKATMPRISKSCL